MLRPGARLFITDIDDGWGLLLEPEPPHLDEVTSAFDRLREERGGDTRIGRRLPRLLTEAGFVELLLDVVAVHTVVHGDESVKETLGGIARVEELVEVGMLSHESFDDLREWNDRYESGEFALDGLLGSLLVSGAA